MNKRNENRSQPPRWAQQLLAFWGNPRTLEEVQGDLQELYAYWAETTGEREAGYRYSLTVLKLLRPLAKRKPTRYPQPFLHLSMLRNYFTTGLRSLKRNWNYTLINVAGLTLSLACCLVLFLAIRYELSYDRHHTQADRIYRLNIQYKNSQPTDVSSAVPIPAIPALRTDFPELKHTVTFTFATEGMVHVQPNRPGRAVRKFEEEFGVMAFIEPEYFNLFDYHFKSGNRATALRNPGTVVLSEHIARKYFGKADAVGRTIRVGNKMDFVVTGIVADPPLTSCIPFEVLLSFASLKQYGSGFRWDDWESTGSQEEAFILLPEKVTPGQMERQLVAFNNKHYRPEYARNQQFRLQPLTEIHFDAQTQNYALRTVSKQMVWAMALIGLFILISACVNFINLATAQAIRRAKEVGVRKVMGSTRGQLVRQFLGETGLLVGIAVVLSLAVAYLALPYVAQLLDVRLTRTALLSPEVLSFLLLLAGLTTLLAGFYPALVLSGYQPVQALKSKVRTAGNGQMYLRRSLIVLQFAISQLLLIGTIVAYSQMKHFRSANLGYNKEAIFTVSIPDRQPKDIAALRAKLAGLPAIASMSFGISAPSSPNNWGTNFRLEGWDKGAPYEVIMRIADTAYFQTYGLQLVAGRLYLPADTIREFVVNETFARKLGYSDPSKIIGRRMHLHSDVAKPIVGVVKDFSLFTLHKQNQPCVLTTLFWAYNKLGIKLAPQAGTEAISQTLAEVERVWTATFPNNVFKYELLDQALNDFYKTEERLYGLFRLLSGIAIFIGCLGLYGVVAFMVESRTKEVGIRKTLGASANDIFAIFSLDFVRLVLIALVLASPLAWYVMNRWLEDFAHKIKIEWWVFALTGLLAVGISLLTVSLQSIKAARMNPVKSLRAE